jgi:hypothetical protein
LLKQKHIKSNAIRGRTERILTDAPVNGELISGPTRWLGGAALRRGEGAAAEACAVRAAWVARAGRLPWDT